MFNTFLEKKFESWQQKNLNRTRFIIDERQSGNDIIIDKNQLINFSNNDYLCLSAHPTIKKMFIKGVEKYGLGSGASPMVAGYFSPHRSLEEKFAEFLQRDQAILFNSGYLANLGLLSSIVTKNNLVLSDKLCHASLLDGIRLSRAKHIRYRHADTQHVECLLQKYSQIRSLFVISESVFSMEGNIASINQLAQSSTQHQATLIIDDAHGVGVIGQQGRGISEYYSLDQADIPYLVTPLGKAFASMGAIISGSHDHMKALLQFANTYRFSTALPPALAFGTLAALKIVQEENWRREKLQAIIKFFISAAQTRSLKLISSDLTPIKSILIGSNSLALRIKAELYNQGFFVSCIRPPTVPKNMARLRISLNCMHQQSDIERLLDTIVTYNEKIE